MIDRFENYVQRGRVKKRSPDPEEAKALLKKSANRLEYTKQKAITANNAEFVLEDAYEAMREAAQSLMSAKGYKPYSHEATISFIKRFYGNEFTEEEIQKLDHMRRLRNVSVYSASPISLEDARSSVILASRVIMKIKSLSERE